MSINNSKIYEWKTATPFLVRQYLVFNYNTEKNGIEFIECDEPHTIRMVAPAEIGDKIMRDDLIY